MQQRRPTKSPSSRAQPPRARDDVDERAACWDLLGAVVDRAVRDLRMPSRSGRHCRSRAYPLRSERGTAARYLWSEDGAWACKMIGLDVIELRADLAAHHHPEAEGAIRDAIAGIVPRGLLQETPPVNTDHNDGLEVVLEIERRQAAEGRLVHCVTAERVRADPAAAEIIKDVEAMRRGKKRSGG